MTTLLQLGVYKIYIMFYYIYFIVAQRLVGLTKAMKQIVQMKHNKIKNANWREANQLTNYKREWPKTRTRDFRVVSPALTTRSRCLQFN